MLITILATIVVLGILILVHELGHFWTAKLVDIEVPRFSIGLGPKMVGFKRGETEYVISWLPLGGYVKMAGMEEMESLEGGKEDAPKVTGVVTADDTLLEAKTPRQAGPRDFESKSLPARVLVISAGVIMNLLFAVVVFASIAMIWGVRIPGPPAIGNVAEEYLPEGAEAFASLPVGAHVVRVNNDTIRDFRDFETRLASAPAGPAVIAFRNHAPITIEVPKTDSARAMLIGSIEPAAQTPAVVGHVEPNTPAAQAGLQPDDLIRSVDGQPVSSWQMLVSKIEARPGQPLQVELERGGKLNTVTLTPEPRDIRGIHYGRIGVAPKFPAITAAPKERLNPISALGHGAAETWNVVALTVEFLGDLFTGEASPRNVGGVIQIGQLSGQVVRLGLEAFLGFMALFSVNLAVLNLLPIPVLDGGHLLFLGVEAVRGKPLSIEQRVRWSQVGFVILLGIMVYAIGNDVLRLFGI